MKYKYVSVVDIIVFPSSSNFSDKNGGKILIDLLEDGYKLFHSSTFNTKEVAGIKYILRKEI